MLFIFSDLCRYLTIHVLERIHVLTICTIYGWLPLDGLRHFNTCPRIVSEYDQEIPQSQTADYPVAPRGRAAQPSRDTRKTN